MKLPMQITRFLDYDCVTLENASLSLLVTQSVGPRIISLRLKGSENLFAELPDFVTELPDGKTFHFYGGHRLWCAPEDLQRTYSLDDSPVDIVHQGNSLSVTQPVEARTGMEKNLHISLLEDKPHIDIRHTLTNHGQEPVECAPWAITQFKTGGVAILPQSREQTMFQPNRSLVIWPYTDVASPFLHWGNDYILIHAEMQTDFKIGFPNRRGWLAYWLAGILFVKRAEFDPHSTYCDFGSSSECYGNDQFLELETLAPISTLAPGESATHTEEWELYANVNIPADEVAVDKIVNELGLEKPE